MKTLLTLIFLSMSMIGCDNLDLMTPESVKDAASCFDSADETDDMYIVYLDKNCVDTELSIPPPVPTTTTEPIVIDRKWELIATLKRDVRQEHWHEFYVQDDIEPQILSAYVEGKDFLFVIDWANNNSFVPIDYYWMQPEPPKGRKERFFRAEGWFRYWVPEKNWAGFDTGIERKPEREGLIVQMDPGISGDNFLHPDNRNKEWLLGEVAFRVTRDKAFLFKTDYEPHINDGIVLKVYAR